MYALLADLTLILHFLFVVFVVLGGLLVIKYSRLYLLHLPCAIYGAAIEFFGWVCPLTYLENYFYRQAQTATYEDSFIQHYLMPLVYPPGLTVSMQLLLGFSVIILNAVIYAYIWSQRARRPMHKQQ